MTMSLLQNHVVLPETPMSIDRDMSSKILQTKTDNHQSYDLKHSVNNESYVDQPNGDRTFKRDQLPLLQ